MKSVIFWFWIQCSRVLLSNYENCTNTNYHKQVSAIPKLFRHQNSFANNDRILPRLTQLLQINFLIVLLLNHIEKLKPIPTMSLLLCIYASTRYLKSIVRVSLNNWNHHLSRSPPNLDNFGQYNFNLCSPFKLYQWIIIIIYPTQNLSQSGQTFISWK